jgi:hypothetical protein
VKNWLRSQVRCALSSLLKLLWGKHVLVKMRSVRYITDGRMRALSSALKQHRPGRIEIDTFNLICT